MKEERVKSLPFRGTVNLAGSKSILQRYLFLHSVKPSKSVLTPGSACEDVMEMAKALISCGAEVSVSEDEIRIDSTGINLSKDTEVCFNASATALRFWLARAALTNSKSIIHISEQLYRRPLKPFLQALEQLGCRMSLKTADNIEYPYQIEIIPSATLPESIEINADISSQFISGLMLSASARPGVLYLKFKQVPVSYTYLELTEYILNACNIYTVLTDRNALVRGGEHLRLNPNINIEPELSAGAFLMALGVFSEQGVGFQDTLTEHFQPDWEMIATLKDMGAKPLNRTGVIGFRKAGLHGITINLENNPDLVPLVSVIALFADSSTTLQGISRLKYKESDRLQGIIKALKQIRAKHDTSNDTLVVFPYDREPEPAVLDTQNDHRLVIAFTLLTLHFPQLSLSGTDSVAKSYPGFFMLLDSLKEA